MSDLIGDNVNIEWDGVNGAVTGDIKYIADYSSLFGAKEKAGAFFPFSLGEAYNEKEITVQRKGGTAKTAVDTEWIVRLTDGAETEYDVSCEGEKIAHFTFAEATLGVPMSVLPQDHDLGKYGKKVNELVGPDTVIHADGSVTGTLKYVEPWKENHDREGHFIAIRLDAQYKDKPVTVQRNGANANTATDEDWILTVSDKNTEITFKDGDVEFMKLTFKDVVFEEETPADYMTVVGQSDDAGYGKQGSDLMSDNVAIAWDGTNGTVTGNFHNIEDWSTLPGGTKSGHFFAMRFNDKFKGKSFDFIMDDQEPGTHTDSAGDDEMYWVLRIDTTKTFTFKSDNKVIAKLDFNGATLDD